MSSSFTTGSASLRPTWSRSSGSQGGRGFQPPPAVPAERRSRSGSQGSSGSGSAGDQRPTNKFAALDDDDDEIPKSASSNSRPPPFRSSSFGADRKSPSGPKGRSLADLVATVPEAAVGRPSSFRSARSDSFSEVHVKVTRFTREKLLALRPRPDPEQTYPDTLKHLEGNPILSSTPLDPVCWDTFDADEIWAQAARERTTRSASLTVPAKAPIGFKGIVPEPVEPGRRLAAAAPGLGKWQRGVALPPPDENSHRRGSGRSDAENPNDLWDDPLEATSAAADFSAFGTIPDDPKDNEDGAFDFNKMTEESRKFDDEMRGITRSPSENGDENGDRANVVTVNPARPLASTGTTIRSGSGDDVNVFEDFDDNPQPQSTAVKAADEDPSASSRLMKMIGVTREDITLPNVEGDDEPDALPDLNPWAAAPGGDDTEKPDEVLIGATGDIIPSNPWGQSIVGVATDSQQGFDLAARLEQAAAEQKAREEMRRRQSQQEAEMLRRRQEEAQRRAMEEQARQQAAKQQAGHSQVELVLMERISVILENSWGRADLVSILATLHSEDPRVVPLLRNAEALRALLARHPSRIALRQDPAFGTEMAVLLVNNAQFQQRNQQQQEIQQRQEAQARAQQEEMRRREQLIRMQQQANQNGRSGLPQMIPDAPWFYSDPQQNIQGPFRGEEMRQWLEAGYFKGDLPISQQPSGPFYKLAALFPNLSVAFLQSDSSSDADAASAAAREEEQRAKEEERRVAAEHARAEAKRRHEAEQRAREAQMLAEAKQKADAIAAEQARKDEKDSSAKLKMMLGLGSGHREDLSQEPPLVDEPAPQQRKSQKQQRSQPAAPVPDSVPSPVGPAKAAWGRSSSAGPRKSMSEIQQEEARRAATLAMERPATAGQSSSGWANVAASRGGGTGWQGGAIAPTSHGAVVTGPPNSNRNIQQTQTKPGSVQRQMSAPASVQQKQRSSSTKKEHQQPADDFGASLSPSLESWCKEQMSKLNGSDDLTLVSFCMTLNDPHEIRQYLTAYLGPTAHVNNFATEFINKRGLGKTQQEEWESTKPKKTKKKGGK